MRRLLSVVVTCFWLVMLALLVRRAWPSAPASGGAPRSAPAPGDEWMGVYHQSQKVGYTHYRLSADGREGFVFSENSLLRLTVLGTPQTVRTRTHGHTRPDFSLRDVDFELSSGAGDLHAVAVVDASQLRVTLRTGKDVSEQVLPLKEPLFLPSTLRASLRPQFLETSRRLDVMGFDPTTLKNDRMQVVIEGRERVPDTEPGIEGWRVKEEFHGVTTTAWLDATGAVVREQGPMGLVLVRESAERAVNEGWSAETALDLVATAAVPVAQPIDDPRSRESLRLRLSGILPEKVPSDDLQVRRGSVLTMTRARLSNIRSYPLPYRGKEYASALKPTAFLQSDHPRIQALTREIVGDERDALRAAIRLNDWVYDHLRKIPTVSIPNALQVLDMGEGDCNEHAVLLAALGRAAGIPTRLVAGIVYLDGAFFYHAWCEVWLGNWISIDPALHQFPADVTHVKFVIGGPDEQLSMMDIIGRLGIEVLEGPADAAG